MKRTQVRQRAKVQLALPTMIDSLSQNIRHLITLLLHIRLPRLSFVRQLSQSWRRSLQFRVVTATLVLSSTVMLLVGFILTSQIIDRLLAARLEAARIELERARKIVEPNLASSNSRSIDYRISTAITSLTNRGETEDTGSTSNHDSVLVAPGGFGSQDISAGPIEQIPPNLPVYVRGGNIAYQYSQVQYPNGEFEPVLVIGSPLHSDIRGLTLYLIFPLKDIQSTVQLVRGTIAMGGIIMIGLLAAVALLITRQVVLPVRQAAHSAVRFASGRLDERVAIRGEDDMARLAFAFNVMAESISSQIHELEEYGNLQRRFTSDVSHELRTPLTTVRMATDLIHDRRDELDPVMRRSAELMKAEVDRFEVLLGDLLEISRHDAGAAELTAEPLDIKIPIMTSVHMVAQLAHEAKTEIVLDLTQHEVIAEIDQRRVQRIVRNLLVNAVDHSEGKPVELSMRANDKDVSIVVRDYGVGLRPGEEKLVFNRFWRSDPSRVRRSGGTGLGLAISLEDAKLHAGTLDAWGEPGIGAAFRLTLPLVKGQKISSHALDLPPRQAGDQ